MQILTTAGRGNLKRCENLKEMVGDDDYDTVFEITNAM